MSKNKQRTGYFSVHRKMLDHWLFEDATDIGLWVVFASEFAYEECEVVGQFTGKPIKLKPNQQVFSTEQLGQLLNNVWSGTKSGKKLLTRHMVNGRMAKWKNEGLIDWVDCDCRTDGRLFTIKTARPNLGETETVSETKPAAPNIKKKSSSGSNNKTKVEITTLPSDLDTPAVREAWKDFVLHRKQLDGKGMTERAEKAIINKLMNANLTTDEVVAELNKAIESGWKSVFPKEGRPKMAKRSGNSTFKQGSDSRVVRHEGFRKLAYEEAMLKNDMEASTSAG